MNYPGFEAHRQGLKDDSLIQETVRVKLTQSLNLVTSDLVEETTESLRDVLGDSREWQTIAVRDKIMDIVARLTSRVFLGKDLCRNERWLEIAKSYTVDSFVGSYLLRLSPSLLQPFVYWLIPQCTALRKAVRDAHHLIDSEVDRRRAAVDKALATGQKPPKVADTIGWMHEVARGRKIDYVAGQLSLTLAAIHTTTEVTCQALLDICEYPEVVQQLRDELITVIGEHGWAKTSLYKLRLMDSFLKESQRYRPLIIGGYSSVIIYLLYMIRLTSLASMNRYVEKEVTLSDGTVLPKGSRILALSNFRDPKIYPNPEEFDAARFMKLRNQPEQENFWQFVTTSPEHMLFGHGQHACPGRFFAANEVKIALCHLLLKYDWRFVPGQNRPAPREHEGTMSVHPKSEVQVRYRQAEIDVDNQ